MNIRAAGGHELVAPALRRVQARRLAYTIGLFEAVGFPHAEAVRRGTLGFTAFVGHSEMVARLPGVLPIDDGDLDAYVTSVLDLLLHGRPADPKVSAGGRHA
ncbi:hypothetical protein R8Z50_15680 [Longispora sp. K20-0274]|uniref:hypothetical protein n=1 Tax=Longispora sp. K20-0274 TaxID=3088255 RepID=UPI00399BC4D1